MDEFQSVLVTSELNLQDPHPLPDPAERQRPSLHPQFLVNQHLQAIGELKHLAAETGWHWHNAERRLPRLVLFAQQFYGVCL